MAMKKNVVAEALGEKNAFKGFVQTPLILCPSGFENQKAAAQEISPQQSMEQLIADVNAKSPMGNQKVVADAIQTAKKLNAK